MKKTIVWVADVGSVKAHKFGWCRATSDLGFSFGDKISDFAEGIAKDISSGFKVALGFECPLFVPIYPDPVNLTSARQGEGNRPWSAGAGCASLAVGLTESVWIFQQVNYIAKCLVTPTFDWGNFCSGKNNLFIWEAFVSGDIKSKTHHGDAEIAARTFWSRYPKISLSTDVRSEQPFSLVGAALLRAGLTNDYSFLSKSNIVIKS